MGTVVDKYCKKCGAVVYGDQTYIGGILVCDACSLKMSLVTESRSPINTYDLQDAEAEIDELNDELRYIKDHVSVLLEDVEIIFILKNVTYLPQNFRKVQAMVDDEPSSP